MARRLTARFIPCPPSSLWSCSWSPPLLPLLSRRSLPPQNGRFLHSTTPHRNDESKELPPDRTWIDGFERHHIPPDSYWVTYSRSSGPGGQNVNKLSTKAQLRFTTVPGAHASWLPEYAADTLRQQQATRINKDGDLLIASDRFRTQRQNRDDCVDKLFDYIKVAGFVARETTAEQRKRVASLYVV
ncbi:hypothetical protein BC828DRAFT_387284 [Blastocladiella britannica]|nr:hypothetical protein BC828DRAFT_387284 [Blastocladiella britannica]